MSEQKSQVIAHGEGGSTHVGEAATRRFQLIAIRSALGLEAKGIKIRRGFSALKAAQTLTGLRTRDREVQAQALTRMVKELEEHIEFVVSKREGT